MREPHLQVICSPGFGSKFQCFGVLDAKPAQILIDIEILFWHTPLLRQASPLRKPHAELHFRL